jgi:ribosome-binding protein aMBF1 (putative translation factor)
MNFQSFTQQDFQCDKCQKEFYGTTFYSREGSEITYCSGCYQFLKQGAAEISEKKLGKTEIELAQAIKELQTQRTELLNSKKARPAQLDDLYKSLIQAERFAYNY